MVNQASNRRRHARVPVRIRIQYRTADKFFQDYIQNLSVGGIFIETSNPLSVGTKLKVQFSIPDLEDPITADGIVVHKLHVGHTGNPPAGGMGIKFAEIDTKSRELLEGYIQEKGLNTLFQ